MQYDASNLLTEQELADLLKVAHGTLRNWRTSGGEHIPYVRVGGSVRYRMEDVIAYLDSKVVANGAI